MIEKPSPDTQELKLETWKRYCNDLRIALKQRDEKIDKMRTIISNLTDLVRENKK